MATDITPIARPYAEAVFERAKERQQIEAWSSDLALLAAVIDDPQIAGQIANPNVSRERVREIVLAVVGEIQPEAKNLLRLLADNGRLAALPEIARLFEANKTAHAGIREVKVRTAFPLGPSEERALAEALRRRLGAEVTIAVEQDSSLLGGVEVRAGDVVIDGSLRGRLHQLANELQV